MSSVRMRVLAVALILMVVCCCCMASDRWSLEAQMHGKTKQLSNQKIPGTTHFDVTDDNHHHYIPPKDFGKPSSDQDDATDDNDHHYASNMDNNYGKPGGLIKTHG
ncbi:unnamed protein product [Sphenostylis stenocarpa]|uniref:Uncharacterized protein n=1 Tax=Sphenostylis stenocarpa TaxID=92480 RepID=A0AA86SID2_9FABA|nr:unnamed protein product [Sphenostylis stenocarpa]